MNVHFVQEHNFRMEIIELEQKPLKVNCTVYTVYSTQYCTQYSTQCTQYSTQYRTQYSTQCTMCTQYSTVPESLAIAEGKKRSQNQG